MHTDGAGSVAFCIQDLWGQVLQHGAQQTQTVRALSDEALAAVILGALRCLGQHATQRTHASGMARLRASLMGSTSAPALQLAKTRGQFPSIIGRVLTAAPAPVETFAALNDLAHGSSALVASAASTTASVTSSASFRLHGEVVWPCWSRYFHLHIDRWAKANGVEILQQPTTGTGLLHE